MLGHRLAVDALGRGPDTTVVVRLDDARLHDALDARGGKLDPAQALALCQGGGQALGVVGVHPHDGVGLGRVVHHLAAGRLDEFAEPRPHPARAHGDRRCVAHEVRIVRPGCYRLAFVANIKSQIKRNKQNERRRLRNKAVRSELRTRLKTAVAVAETGAEESVEALRLAVKKLDKAAAKGVIHKNQAANRKSRLMRRIAKITTPASAE
jgi:small subunit ribosomal protein S20